MEGHIALNYLTGKPRNIAIQELENLCQTNVVNILDFHMFSNSSLSIQFEADAAGISALAQALERNSFQIVDSSVVHLEKMAKDLPESKVSGTIQVSFMNEDGDLKIEVTMVPG